MEDQASREVGVTRDKMGCKSIGWRVDIEVVKARVGEMKLSQGDGREGHRTEAHESDIGRRMGCMFRE